MNRGDRREAIFLGDSDRELLVDTFAETCDKTGWSWSMGARLLKEVTDLPMGSFSVIADPQGATVGLWQFAEGCGDQC